MSIPELLSDQYPLAPVTNLLAMPALAMTVTVANNEDWIDSIVYLMNSTDPTAPQLDIRDIDFYMEVRRAPPDAEVVIRASTKTGGLAIGEPPNFGYLLFNIPHETMKLLVAGNYYGDIVGEDGFVTRRTISLVLTIEQGLTRP
jgi:hypothetical protein